jgi:hypothetical protein
MSDNNGSTEMTAEGAVFLAVLVIVTIGLLIGGIFFLKWVSSASTPSDDDDNDSKAKKNKSDDDNSSKSSKSSKKKKDKFENVLNNEDKIVGFNINYLNNYANV